MYNKTQNFKSIKFTPTLRKFTVTIDRVRIRQSGNLSTFVA